jgi:hypothetical protein
VPTKYGIEDGIEDDDDDDDDDDDNDSRYYVVTFVESSYYFSRRVTHSRIIRYKIKSNQIKLKKRSFD